MSKKKHKVIVVGLPKTGTSTLAVMLRMLNYDVTGPNIDYKFKNTKYLYQNFMKYDGFQDYPWCFEWKRFSESQDVKFIVLNRDFESWWESFYESYGRKNEDYLSYPYMKISKVKENKNLFFDYFVMFYQQADYFAKINPERVLNIDVKSFEWNDLCQFLDEKQPKGIFGKKVKKPHVNKQNAKSKKTFRFKLQKKIKDFALLTLGQKLYLKVISFLRKNNML